MGLDAICVGEFLIDLTPTDAKRTYRANPGGAPANVAVAMARLGLDVGLISKVGMDDLGDLLLDELQREGVHMLCKDRAENAVTTLVFVSLREDGERSFTFVRKPGADMMLSKEDIRCEDIQTANILHAGSVSMTDEPARSATLYAMEMAHALGKIVSFDVNYRDNIWNGEQRTALLCIEQALKHTDILKVSDEECAMLCKGRTPDALLEDFGIHAVVVTRGEAGADLYMREGACHAPTIARCAVDTTGAGDAFWGSVLASLSRQGIRRAGDITLQQMEEALRWGNAAGGYCVERPGAIPSMPFMKDLLAFVKNTPVAAEI